MDLTGLFALNPRELLIPSASLVDIVVRGSVVYLGLFVFLRFFRRETGAVGISDVLVVVLIADASQNAMAGGYTSLTEGALLVLVIGAWDYGLDWLGFHVPALRPLLRPKPLPLVVDGVLQKKNLRRELITLDELMTQLRQQGVEHIKDVKRCLMEGDGTITVIAHEGTDKTKPDRAATP